MFKSKLRLKFIIDILNNFLKPLSILAIIVTTTLTIILIELLWTQTNKIDNNKNKDKNVGELNILTVLIEQQIKNDEPITLQTSNKSDFIL